MNHLLATTKKIILEGADLPFSVYRAVHEQRLLNVPIAKPLLVVVMSGVKELGKHHEIRCSSGQFIFLSDNPAIDMRNIPKSKEYCALLTEFDYDDFDQIPNSRQRKSNYITGEVTRDLEHCLIQFVECTRWAAADIYSSRKKEILGLLYQLCQQQCKRSGNRQFRMSGL